LLVIFPHKEIVVAALASAFSACCIIRDELMSEQKKSRRQMLEEFIAKKPDDAFSRYGLALECSNSGDTTAADSHFRMLTDQFPDYIPAYLMYAQMLARIERADDARQILTKGISAAANKGDDHARSEMESLLADLS
jgi:predicted Zn-dependent protease